jgi:hypothetical protein
MARVRGTVRAVEDDDDVDALRRGACRASPSHTHTRTLPPRPFSWSWHPGPDCADGVCVCTEDFGALVRNVRGGVARYLVQPFLMGFAAALGLSVGPWA